MLRKSSLFKTRLLVQPARHKILFATTQHASSTKVMSSEDKMNKKMDEPDKYTKTSTAKFNGYFKNDSVKDCVKQVLSQADSFVRDVEVISKVPIVEEQLDWWLNREPLERLMSSPLFNFDDPELLFPKNKAEEVDELIRTKASQFIVLSGRSGDGKSYLARRIAGKHEKYVIKLNMQRTYRMLSLLLELDTIVEDLVVRLMLYLHVLLKAKAHYGEALTPTAFLEMIERNSMDTMMKFGEGYEGKVPLNEMLQEVKEKVGDVIFFVDEAHIYRELRSAKTIQNKEDSLGLLARALKQFGYQCIFASTKMRSASLALAVPFVLVDVPAATLRDNPAQSYVNKFMNIVDKQAVEHYNHLLGYTTVRAHTWLMTEFYRKAHLLHKNKAKEINKHQLLRQSIQDLFSVFEWTRLQFNEFASANVNIPGFAAFRESIVRFWLGLPPISEREKGAANLEKGEVDLTKLTKPEEREALRAYLEELVVFARSVGVLHGDIYSFKDSLWKFYVISALASSREYLRCFERYCSEIDKQQVKLFRKPLHDHFMGLVLLFLASDLNSESATIHTVFSGLSNTFLKDYTLKLVSVDHTATEATAKSYSFFGLQDKIAFKPSPHSDIFYCTLVPTEGSTAQDRVTVLASTNSAVLSHQRPDNPQKILRILFSPFEAIDIKASAEDENREIHLYLTSNNKDFQNWISGHYALKRVYEELVTLFRE